MRRKLVSTADRYIFTQPLVIYFLSIILVLTAAIISNAAEKLDRLLQPDVSLRAIIWGYYANFVPYYAGLFSPLFVFMAVTYVTSRLAENSEIIAILGCDMSFRRLLKPYILGVAVITILTFLLSGFVIPPGNHVRIDFQNRHIKDKRITCADAIQMQVAPETFMLMSYYNNESKAGYTFSMDRFEGKDFKSRVTASNIIYDILYSWRLQDYTITCFDERQDVLFRENRLDTIIPITPRDFLITGGNVEMLTTPELYHSIQQQRMKGATAQLYAIELYEHVTMIPTSFISTLTGVSLSAHKHKGGMGLTLAMGPLLSSIHILFMAVTVSFMATGAMAPTVAAWLPNSTYLGIFFILYRLAPRQIESGDARRRERRDSTR